ncbi:hypothetical protein ACX5I6_21250 [Arthrobacter sp. MMS24-T111]
MTAETRDVLTFDAGDCVHARWAKLEPGLRLRPGLRAIGSAQWLA